MDSRMADVGRALVHTNSTGGLPVDRPTWNDGLQEQWCRHSCLPIGRQECLPHLSIGEGGPLEMRIAGGHCNARR